MSDAPASFPPEEPVPATDSLNTRLVIVDGQGDTTVRPARPSLARLLQAERERIAKWRGQPPQPPDAPPHAR
jgi:hypothetical protein